MYSPNNALKRAWKSTGHEYIVWRNARKEMLTKQSFHTVSWFFTITKETKKRQFRKDRAQQHLRCTLHHISTKYLNTSILLKFPQMLYQNFSFGCFGCICSYTHWGASGRTHAVLFFFSSLFHHTLQYLRTI